jgi:hypothetical protein
MTMRPQLFRCLFVLALSSSIALAASVTASPSGTAVDPSTLNPPPPPAFNPVCEKVGGGTICTVNFTETFGGGSGVVCGSGANAYEVFQFQQRTVQGRRYYDENGNLTRRHFKEVLEGTLTNPLNHQALSYSGRSTHLHDLTIPGDITSGTENITGSVQTYLPQGGTVLIDAGRTIEAADGSALLKESGQHPFLDYIVFGDTAAVQPLCDALQ